MRVCACARMNMKAPPGFEKQFLNQVTGPLKELNNLLKKLTNRFNDTEAAADKYHKGVKEYIELNKDHHDLLVATDSLMKFAKAFDNLSKGNPTGFKKLNKKQLDDIIKKQRPTDKKKSRTFSLQKGDAVTKEEYEDKRNMYLRFVKDAKMDLEDSLNTIVKKREQLKELDAAWGAKWDKWHKLYEQHQASEQSIHEAHERLWGNYENLLKSQSSRSRASSRSRTGSDLEHV